MTTHVIAVITVLLIVITHGWQSVTIIENRKSDKHGQALWTHLTPKLCLGVRNRLSFF